MKLISIERNSNQSKNPLVRTHLGTGEKQCVFYTRGQAIVSGLLLAVKINRRARPLLEISSY